MPLSDSVLRHILDILREHLQVPGVSFSRAGQVFESGRSAQGDAVPFLDGTLVPGFFLAEFSQKEKSAIAAAERIARVFDAAGRADKKPPAVSSQILLRGVFDLAVQLDTKNKAVVNYDRILQLNEQILLAEGLDGVLQVLMDTARDALNGMGSSLLLVDPRTGELYFNVVSGENEGELKEIRIPPGKGIAGSVVRTGQPELIRDVVSDPRTFQEVDQRLEQKTRDMIVSPLVARERVIGVVEVINSRSSGGFTSEDLEFLTNIAAHTSLLIDNARNHDDLVKTNHALDRKISELNAFSEVSRVLNSTLDPVEMRRGLLRTLLKIMRIGYGSILIPDANGKIAVSETRIGHEGVSLDESSPPVVYEQAADILLWMKQNREPFFFMYSAGSETEGLARRFSRENPRGFSAEEKPDLWVPVFAGDGETISFIVALGDITFRRKQPSDDLTFFKGIMSLAYAAVRNVESYKQAVISQEREERIRRAFQKYVPGRVVEDVMTQEESPTPRSQKISVLFADIRNFTQHAENREPRDLLELLNEFFEEMVECVSRGGGIVDKFMGDSVMALFGVPDPGTNDAKQALITARDMVSRLDVLNHKRREEGRPEFQIGIGLNAGPAVVGNMGARRRMDFTAVGDTVNLGARLEQLTKVYRTRILFTEDMLREAPDAVCREVDLIQARGRTQVTRVYQLAADPSEEALFARDRIAWDEMLKAYRMRHFWDCLQILINIKDDPLAEVFRLRCEAYVKTAPPPDWNGAFTVDAAVL
jgi:class 3 adenylate cyclase